MDDRELFQIIAGESEVTPGQVEKTAALLDDGNTVPFIARYRKEVTGELDEVKIRLIEERLKFYRNLNLRKEEVIRLIEEQGKLTPELKERILSAQKPTQVEDLYRPYRQKRKTRASVAREKGLEPLARYLLSFPRLGQPLEEAAQYLNPEKGVALPEEALQGAMDIVAEEISDDPDIRSWIRNFTFKSGVFRSAAREAAAPSVYEMYYDYREPVSRIAPHRVLAVNRGEREEFLKVAVEVDEERILEYMARMRVKTPSVTSQIVLSAVKDSYRRLIAPAVERDVRNELTDRADEQAILIFSKNLRQLLLQPPVKGKTVLGVDPAYRTGCKWAVVDDTGKMLEVGVVYPTPPQKRVEEALLEFRRLADKYGIDIIAIGNGTASRETEQFVVSFIGGYGKKNLQYIIVNEAGASVYSASELAAREFPELDVTGRSAVSIARRLQDPLAELVKIEPRSVGVGQYQHDVAPKRLEESLTTVVESVVNHVGCDLNTASAPLLSYISGISATLAGNIVKFREEKGRFTDRGQLKKVPRLGPKTFEQCVGFLRIPGGGNPLDGTSIHPESYELALKILELCGCAPNQAGTPELRSRLKQNAPEKVAADLGAGLPTVRDILESLSRPGRDPREDLPGPLFRSDVLSMEDLQPGMELRGTVRNVVDFGAFVDIGVKVDGLVHRSQLSDGFVRHPMDAVAVGDVVTVRVLEVDTARQRVALSMKGLN
ncbi:transcription accessory protein [Desulfocucumis palustris]|uniref:Transcription accessory protein n=1 Tax=Desulfocucumis palustris TaxID=1898651 RepID=A0A2L2XEE1_9FIRM|nr:Tex family protein [Desulfocucumis palustris]GBF34605.1 transcription accessory protein [Desulfocucumis palustris]